MTRLVRKPLSQMGSLPDFAHILTYAEEGFSPLSMHCRTYRVPKEEEKAFVAAVNQRDETGSLYPRAPISAIPRRLIREPSDYATIGRALTDFLAANRNTIHATRVWVDFGCPAVSKILELVVGDVMVGPEDSDLEEVVLLIW